MNCQTGAKRSKERVEEALSSLIKEREAMHSRERKRQLALKGVTPFSEVEKASNKAT